MSIEAIITQPATNSVYAAYRPIVFRVSAKKTNGDPIPPVVFCDVYVNGLYYKTFSSTQYIKLNVADSEFQFDIQDALQESLTRYLGANGGSAILTVMPPIASVQCKFRSSGIDTEGFLQQEGTVPVQGTLGVPPIAGTGTESNTFFAINATLQHEDNQDVLTHLDSYKQRDWDANAHPLTHRPEGYKICKNQSDYFPILSIKQPLALSLFYRPRNSASFIELGYNYPCGEAISIITSEELPDGAVGNPYYFAIGLTGSLPFVLAGVTKPAWMTIVVNALGTLLEFSGTPDIGGVDIPVSLSISNCCGVVTLVVNELITIVSCVAGAISGAPDLPNAVLNTAYVYDINLTGTQPFNLNNIVKPAWMTINVVGAQIQLRGTPDESGFGTAIPVSFDIANCGGSVPFSDTLDLPGGYACGANISVDTPTGVYEPGIYYYLNIAPGTTNVALNWNSGERPNRLTLYENGLYLASTSWVGYANYPGPWGSNLSTAQSGTINFAPVAGRGYKIRIEIGPWDPTNNLTDHFDVTISCS
jgi:hypothetical protein